MNRRAKFDAASFILSGEIRHRRPTNKQTNKQTNKNQTQNGNQYIRTLPYGMCG